MFGYIDVDQVDSSGKLTGGYMIPNTPEGREIARDAEAKGLGRVADHWREEVFPESDIPITVGG